MSEKAEDTGPMEYGDDGAVDHHGEVLPLLSKRSSHMQFDRLLDISTPNHDGKTPGSRFFTAIGYFWLGLTNRIQYRTHVVSGLENVPKDRGSLCTAWHTNAVLDLVQIMLSHPKRFVIGARHDLVLRPVLGWWSRKFAVQPVIRKAELIRGGCTEEEATHLNGKSLRALADGISAGFGCALFPEGTSHSKAHLLRLRTGPMRTVIAAAGISQVEGRPMPVLQPVGLHYRVRHLWRTDCWIEYGKPLDIPEEAIDSELVEALKDGGWREPRADAVTALRDQLREKLSPMTPGAPDWPTHRAWHLLGHLRSRVGGGPPVDWRAEVLAARKERDALQEKPDDALLDKAQKAARILDENDLDGRDITTYGNIRKSSLLNGVLRLPLLVAAVFALPIFLYSCGIQTVLAYKIGNVTDEGMDARTTFQYLIAMFGSFFFFPPLALILILFLHLLVPMSWAGSLPEQFSLLQESLILQVSVEFCIIMLAFWLSVQIVVAAYDTIDDAARGRRRTILRKTPEGPQLETSLKEIISTFQV